MPAVYDQAIPSAAQAKGISLAPPPASEIDSMLLRLLRVVETLDSQQQEIESRLRALLSPQYPSAVGEQAPECSSAHGVALAEIGTRILSVIDRNVELMNRLQL
ncbi:hypothetical protein [Burkholderia sp. BE12]|uniref:hypothetical protein n=1 Tax=Burkholderia sp. BE12 TaxID=2082394 RepID=UPI001319E47A|nr:hypothetical protein [Burkholderia sp. BE12]